MAGVRGSMGNRLGSKFDALLLCSRPFLLIVRVFVGLIGKFRKIFSVLRLSLDFDHDKAYILQLHPALFP
jgi:hypothetical protein